jgi:hypothetical protein
MRASGIAALFGASLLSASASLPLHLLPLLIVAVVADPAHSAADAGWMASACLLGQLCCALGLPALRLANLTRNRAIAAVAVLLMALAASATWPAHQLWMPWLVIGAACGALQFLGATTAAAAQDPPRAFALRLSVTLLVSGLVIFGLRHSAGFLDYRVLALALAVFFALLTGLGLVLYRPPGAPSASTVVSPFGTRVNGRGSLLGLLVVFLLFVGQPGFWAFAVQTVQQRGVVVQDVALAMAFCKVAAGLLLAALTLFKTDRPGQVGLALPAIGVAVGVTGMALAPGAALFLVALLFWELGLNVLSARLQAAVVLDNPASAGAWLTGAALLGTATGPVLHAMAIEGGVQQAFVIYACVSAMFPVAWASARRRI